MGSEVGGSSAAGGAAGGNGAGGIAGSGMGGVAGVAGNGAMAGAGGANCIVGIRASGYSTATQTCAGCLENGMSLDSKCRAMLDCMEPLWPCSDCFTSCLNDARGDDVVRNCVRAMTSSACGSP
jgi:hypothetical protein